MCDQTVEYAIRHILSGEILEERFINETETLVWLNNHADLVSEEHEPVCRKLLWTAWGPVHRESLL